MKNNLYYKPTLEDFTEGLEYEWKFSSEGYKLFTHSFKLILPDLQNMRVKYLDKSDIESLGWIDGETMGMRPFIFNKVNSDNEFQLYYQFDNQFAQIYNCHSEFVFQGFIKNKQELIKLMQQLNIK